MAPGGIEAACKSCISIGPGTHRGTHQAGTRGCSDSRGEELAVVELRLIAEDVAIYVGRYRQVALPVREWGTRELGLQDPYGYFLTFTEPA